MIYVFERKMLKQNTQTCIPLPYIRIAYVKGHQVSSCVPRELEARVGATPPPSPSDRTDSAILTSRITQLSKEVKTLRRRLAEVEAKSEASYCVGGGATYVCSVGYVGGECWAGSVG